MDDERIAYRLKFVQHAVRLAMDDALRIYGLTTPQYAALDHLSRGVLSGAELARRCFVTPQTMNAIMANLTSSGMVARTVDPRDARAQRLELTEEGREAFAIANSAIDENEARLVSALDREERRQLAALLERCAATLSDERRDTRA